MYLKTWTTILLVITLSGCASTAEHLRSQPVAHLPPSASIPVPADLQPYVELSCTRAQDTDFAKDGKATAECLYASVDASKLAASVPPGNPGVRDKALNFLIGISDMNCSNFLHRAFANKAGLDFTKSFMGDLATAVSAGTAHANPTISAAVGVGNLVIGKGVESFNATYYYEKTFQALKSVIMANRLGIKRQIIAKQAAAVNAAAVPYDLTQAISDIREYDDACSIMNGLDELVQVAGTKKSDEEAAKKTVEISADPVKTQRDLLKTQ
jgi:hypothetical protein